MISPTSKFKLLDKGFNKAILLVPGWASDYRIFAGLDLDYNYLLPLEVDPFNFEKDLTELFEAESIDKISLFGWSMGGFLAADFSAKNPDKVDELILVSVQKKYSRELLEDIKLKVKQNKKAFLYKLYFNCFSDTDSEGLNWFKEHLLNSYVDELGLEGLSSGLDYLSKAEIIPASLSGIKRIRIFHGECDKIASYDEALQIKTELKQAEFITLKGIGHTPFLNRQFKDKFSPSKAPQTIPAEGGILNNPLC